jgi:hypothetical protein
MSAQGSAVLMTTGLLWFDDNAKVPLATKIENAARRYRERFGRSPNVCYVHPNTLAGEPLVEGAVKVVELASVQPNHFWIGVQRAKGPSGESLAGRHTSC